MVEGVVVIALGFDVDVHYLVVGVDQRGSKFGSNFDVVISLRQGECRGGGLQ
jgi:hypothetical protein